MQIGWLFVMHINCAHFKIHQSAKKAPWIETTERQTKELSNYLKLDDRTFVVLKKQWMY